MLRLLRSNSFFFFTHLSTFVVGGVAPFAKGKTGFFPAMALLVPAWLTSSVLWSEREESPAFLRILPITDREVALSRFCRMFLATSVYWLILFSAATYIGNARGDFASNFALMNLCCVLGFLLACTWYIAIWRFGVSALTPVMVTYVLLNVIASILLNVDFSSGDWAGAQGMALIRWLAGFPWYLDLLLLLPAGLTSYWILQVAVRTREGASFEAG